MGTYAPGMALDERLDLYAIKDQFERLNQLFELGAADAAVDAAGR